jgi:uncharacterized protein YndB with AHSA1/START domain
MLKKIALVVLLLVGCVLAYAATKPNTMHVERTTTINAPPEKIYPLLSDFHSWASWSPYERIDPAMKKTYGGAPSGKGAVYEWSGNSDVGQGRMEIVDTTEPTRVGIKLDFLSPFEAHNTATFSLTPTGNATDVSWAMDGPSPYVMKVMSVFTDMDAMLGKDFASGLASLKALAEK